jgi:phosphate starvation-inducible PhoH-like protein
LPARQKSGLAHCLELLSKVNDIGIVYLNEKDVIRHNLVMQIIQAYKQEVTRTIKEK